jgi:hypothetical protein
LDTPLVHLAPQLVHLRPQLVHLAAQLVHLTAQLVHLAAQYEPQLPNPILQNKKPLLLKVTVLISVTYFLLF